MKRSEMEVIKWSNYEVNIYEFKLQLTLKLNRTHVLQEKRIFLRFRTLLSNLQKSESRNSRLNMGH